MRIILLVLLFTIAAHATYRVPTLLVRPGTTGTRPAGAEGQFYANSTLNLPQFHNGTSWFSFLLAGQASIVNADINASAAIVASKLLGTDIATVGTITAGTWNGSVVTPQYGGTGIANSVGETITLVGDDTITFTTTANSSVTLPTSGTLATTTDITAGQTTSYDIKNLGLGVSVAASALTIAIKQSDGTTDPSSGTAAATIGFRSATAATGSYSSGSVTAATSLVISSGSTLGHVSAVASYIYVYAINNAGTVELAASSSLYDDGSVVTTTAEGGAGAADSVATIYSTSARTGVALRLIGRLTSTQATAGTWATAIAETSLVPFLATPMNRTVRWTPTSASWVDADLTFTGMKWREGDRGCYKVHVAIAAGVSDAVGLTITMPAGEVIDTAKFPVAPVADQTLLSRIFNIIDVSVTPDTNLGGAVLYDSTTTVEMRHSITFDGNAYVNHQVALTGTVPYTWAAGDYMDFEWCVPIVGW